MSKKPRSLASEQSDLSIITISMDPNIYQEVAKAPAQGDQEADPSDAQEKTNSL